VSTHPEVRRVALACGLVLVLVAISFLVFRGYLTPEMMVYFLTFQWCF
jgi:hypothetical protein